MAVTWSATFQVANFPLTDSGVRCKLLLIIPTLIGSPRTVTLKEPDVFN